uniref:Retrovirus-related Pol polyprotein from transposon TNT 1-94-like beta-barrel domain-containing protein n=1 Tax=Fusarium oxysporum (strain Fo5176) TaxID=660025 RepID=A0A0C4BL28_FUSOF
MRVEGVNSDDEGGKEGRRTHGGDEPIPAAFPSGLGGIARPGRLVAGHFAYKNNLPAVGNDIITFRARPWMHLPGSSSRGSFISSRGPLAAIDTVAQDPAIGAPTLLIRVSKRAPCILATAYTTAFSRLPPSHIPAWVPLRTLLPLALVTAVVLLRVRSSHRLPSVVAPSARMKWPFDTGSTVHICNRRSLLRELRSATRTVLVTGGGKVFPSGRGTVNFTFISKWQEGVTINLKDTLYIPEFPVNVM